MMSEFAFSHIAAGLSLALAFGGMSFFSAVLAPLVFTKLPVATAGAFIRQVFPWYYLAMGAATLVAMISLILEPGGYVSWQVAAMGLVVIGFVYARQFLMPAINRARDADINGDRQSGRRFHRLHRLSVVINGLQWAVILAALVALLA